MRRALLLSALRSNLPPTSLCCAANFANRQQPGAQNLPVHISRIRSGPRTLYHPSLFQNCCPSDLSAELLVLPAFMHGYDTLQMRQDWTPGTLQISTRSFIVVKSLEPCLLNCVPSSERTSPLKRACLVTNIRCRRMAPTLVHPARQPSSSRGTKVKSQ